MFERTYDFWMQELQNWPSRKNLREIALKCHNFKPDGIVRRSFY